MPAVFRLCLALALLLIFNYRVHLVVVVQVCRRAWWITPRCWVVWPLTTDRGWKKKVDHRCLKRMLYHHLEETISICPPRARATPADRPRMANHRNIDRRVPAAIIRSRRNLRRPKATANEVNPIWSSIRVSADIRNIPMEEITWAVVFSYRMESNPNSPRVSSMNPMEAIRREVDESEVRCRTKKFLNEEVHRQEWRRKEIHRNQTKPWHRSEEHQRISVHHRCHPEDLLDFHRDYLDDYHPVLHLGSCHSCRLESARLFSI